MVTNEAKEQARPFEGLLGDTTELRIAEKLMALRSFLLNQKEVAERVGITRQSAAKVLEKFQKWGLVLSESKGNQLLYKLNEGSPLSFGIDALNGALLEILTGQELVDRTPTIEVSKMGRDFVRIPGATGLKGKRTPLSATAA